MYSNTSGIEARCGACQQSLPLHFASPWTAACPCQCPCQCLPWPAAVGALSLAVTVGSSTAGVASLVMNIVLLLSVVVSGAPPLAPLLALPCCCACPAFLTSMLACINGRRRAACRHIRCTRSLEPLALPDMPLVLPSLAFCLSLFACVAGMLVNPESMPDWIGWTHCWGVGRWEGERHG
jgi:hypothetical protein